MCALNEVKGMKLKMQYLDCILSEEEKIEVISSFKDVSYMASLLNTIRDSVIRDSIIEFILDYLRMQLITFTYGHLRSVLVASLNDDYLKLRYLDCVDDKMIVYMSFGDDLKEKYINQVDSYLDKMALIYSFHNPLKRKYYEKKYQKDLSFDLGIDSLLQFGLEIEAEGVNEKTFLNISSSDDDYRVTRDGTLILGVEVKTPKLRNNNHNLSKLYYICNALEKAGFVSSSRTGGHIHFDASYFTCKEDYYGLFEIWTSVEEILYLILDDVGSIPRWDVSGFATSFVDSLNGQKEVVCESFYKEDEEFIKDLHLWQNDKHNGLNLTHVQSGTNTIEFRVPNGTVSFPVWVQNIKLLGRLMMVSKRLSSFYKNGSSDSRDYTLWNLKEQLLEDRCEEEKLELLLNLLFLDEEKEVYRERYYTNKSLLNEENNPFGKMHFESMNLTRKKFKFY